MKKSVVFPTMAALLTISSAVYAADFVLASNGESRAQIVLAQDQTAAPTRFAAQELQRYVKAMSGALLPLGRRRASSRLS